MIDFVIMWVDEKDPDWRKSLERYMPKTQDDARVRRYRSWDNLKYWFRGVQEFAPWVNNVFFITCGQTPEWLNVRHPKLKMIRHEDYIPIEYLPLFNSSAIEIGINKIVGLSEQFVLFNDDMFLIKKTSQEDFFKNGKPCDSATLNIHSVVLGKTDIYASLQATGLVNKYFDMHEAIRNNILGWFSPLYGLDMLRTLYLLPCKVFPEIRQFHLPSSFLKSTFDEVWDKETDLFLDTYTHRFRNKLDYTQWSMRNWQIASGNFSPRSTNIGKEFTIGIGDDTPEECVAYINGKKGKLICINEGELDEEEFDRARNMINCELERLLPRKSDFEK